MNKADAVRSALARNTPIAMRAEKVQNYELLYVEAIDVASFESNENQLIYGRRGTGKTHLLGTLASRINGNDQPAVAMYFNATDFVQRVGEVARLPLPEQANAFFHSFIELLAQKLFDLVAVTFDGAEQGEFSGIRRDHSQAERRSVVENLMRLIDAAAVGTHFLPGPELRMMIDRLEQLAQSGEVEAATLSTILESTQGSGLIDPHYPKFNLAKVRELIVQIVRGLGLDYIAILIDEWMHIQRSQIEFAELLRQCLFGTDAISVKIAADQYRDHLGNASIGHEFRGLEIGADIFVKADLDQPFRSADSEDLYTEVLYRRLAFLEPELVKHFGPPALVNKKHFIEALFANTHAFEELCRGAQGICREFHEAFQACISKRGRIEPVDFQLVQRVLVENAAPMYRSIKNPAASTMFGDLIVPHVSNTGAHFLTDQTKSEFSYLVDTLLSRRVIHGVPMGAELDPTIKAKFDVFEIEYGIYLEQRRKAQYIPGAAQSISLAELDTSNCSDYILDFEPIRIQLSDLVSKMYCESCGQSFSKYNQYYVVAGRCPNPSCLASQVSWTYDREDFDDET